MKHKKIDPALDLPETSVKHGEIIKQKKFLFHLYCEWYLSFKNYVDSYPPFSTIDQPFYLEIGSGGGFMKEIVPSVKTSDILPLPGLDYIFSAENLPFQDNSIHGVFMLNVLHHIPNAHKFFKEISRCLVPKGILYMIEPANTPFSRLIYQYFHHEPFDPSRKEWSFESTGPLSGANGALPWIIFKRDYSIFQKQFPSLRLQSYRNHTPLRYLLSGGLSHAPIVPSFTYPLVKSIEYLLSPINTFLGLFTTIIITKEK